MILSLASFHCSESRKNLIFLCKLGKQLVVLMFLSSDIKFSLGTEHLSGSVLCYILNNKFTIAVVPLFSSCELII